MTHQPVPPPWHVALQVPAMVGYQQRLLHGVADYARDRGLADVWRIDYHPHVNRFMHLPPICHGLIRQVETDEIGLELLASGVRIVGVLSRAYGDPRLLDAVPHVQSDDVAVGRLAAKHLMERGIRSFGFFGEEETLSVGLRKRGFAEQLAEAKLPLSVMPHQPVDEAAADWLRGLPRPAGVMAFNDLQGRVLLDLCRQVGLHVPDDVAVVGVDDDPLLCAFSSPPLSSVITGTRQMGYLAARLLDRMLRGGERRPDDPPPVPPVGVVTRQSSEVLAVEDEDVAAAVRFIRENACEHGSLGINAVARQANVGRRRLEQKFRQALGLTPLGEIRRVRMNRGAELLATTSLSVGEVAARCGYSAQSRFGADFRATWGQTPLAYRRDRRTPLQ